MARFRIVDPETAALIQQLEARRPAAARVPVIQL
jgi:hypothetical protein